MKPSYNRHRQYVLFRTCVRRNNHLNNWWIDQVVYRYGRQPFGDNVKFRIRMKTGKGYSLSLGQHLGSDRYYIRMYHDAPWDLKQWWFFNRRTRTIRPVTKRSHSITVYDGNNEWPRLSKYAILTRYRRKSNKPWYYQATYFSGRYNNIRNPSGFCLSMWANNARISGYAAWKLCTRSASMNWRLDRRGVRYPRYPLRDGRKFQIKSRLSKRRALIYYNRSGHQWYLRIQNNNPYNIKQWWVFDWRTKSIRAAGNISLVVSIQLNGRNWKYYNYYGVVRKYRGEQIQKVRWFNGRLHNIRDLSNRCLNVQSNYDAHLRYVMWYKCKSNMKGSAW